MIVSSFVALGIAFMLSLPIITSKFAKRMGRNPKIWFMIGIMLPVIATFILFFLPDHSDEKNQFENLKMK